MAYNVITDKDKTIKITVEPQENFDHSVHSKDEKRRNELIDRILACVAGYERNTAGKRQGAVNRGRPGKVKNMSKKNDRALEALLTLAFRTELQPEISDEQAEKLLNNADSYLSLDDKKTIQAWGTEFIEKICNAI